MDMRTLQSNLPQGMRLQPAKSDPRIIRVMGEGNGFGRGFLVEEKPLLYLYRNCPAFTLPGYQTLQAASHIGGIICTDAAAELEQYLQENRDNMDIYESPGFWQHAVSLAAREENPIPSFHLECDLHESPTLILTRNWRDQALYDPTKETMHYQHYDERERTVTPTTPFAVAYGDGFAEQLLSRRHLAEGRAPAALSELMRIAKFLAGKPTVRLLYGDGTEVKTKRRKTILGIEDVLQVEARCIHVNGEKFERRHVGLPDAMAHGHERLDVNAEALREATAMMQAPAPQIQPYL